jgi:NAD(P)-dependent dehydrogenase (short-subunit alcohol dehydrogenase family)
VFRMDRRDGRPGPSGCPMADRLAGRTAVVFGGGHAGDGPHGVHGIGFACATAFAAAGAATVVVDRNEEAAKRAADTINEAGGRAIHVVADMLVEDEVEAAVQSALTTFDHIDIVQNNIGQTLLGGPLDISLEQWRRTIAVNLDTVFLGARATLPHLLKTRGSMINISSTASIRWTGYRYPAYAAAKAAVNQLTQSMALQYADTGVRINAILAGLIDSPLAYRELADGQDIESMRATRDADSPTGRMGSARDVAGAALFLASSDSAYITGTMLCVDGGLHARVL